MSIIRKTVLFARNINSFLFIVTTFTILLINEEESLNVMRG